MGANTCYYNTSFLLLNANETSVSNYPKMVVWDKAMMGQGAA